MSQALSSLLNIKSSQNHSNQNNHEGVVFSGLHVTGLKPCKRPYEGNALNKAGRLVLKGKCHNQLVKVYQAATPAHAEFIAAISADAVTGDFLPKVLATKERFVLCEWISGNIRSRPTSSDLLALQTRIHSVSTSGLPSAGYDYWKDFVKPRFMVAAELVGEQVLAADVIKKVDFFWSTSTQLIMHPDLTRSNTVFSSSGKWMIIDNELLSTGSLPLLDVCNTVHSMEDMEGQEYADMYLKQNRINLKPNDLEVLSAAWLGRIAGSAFVSGNLSKVNKVFKEYQIGKNILPFGIN